MRTHYDAAVIGGGVSGVWTAWRLPQAGRRLVLVDTYGVANSRASSGGESRVIRMVLFFGVPPGSLAFTPPAMPAWIDFRGGLYGVPDLENRGVKVGIDRHGTRINPDTDERAVSRRAVVSARRQPGDRCPALARAPLLEARVCQYENTSTGDFLIDRHPEFENVWLVGGGSGHGFKHGPAVCEYVVAQLAGAGPVERRFTLGSKPRVFRRAVY